MFNNHAQTSDNKEMPENCEACLDAVRTSIFPHRAAALQKRYMCRHIRKPRSMKTREWLACVYELNNYLPRFPRTGRQAKVPEKLADDQIEEIAEYGIPYSWITQMHLQNFDIGDLPMEDFINFCKQLETLDSADGETDATKKEQ